MPHVAIAIDIESEAPQKPRRSEPCNVCGAHGCALVRWWHDSDAMRAHIINHPYLGSMDDRSI